MGKLATATKANTPQMLPRIAHPPVHNDDTYHATPDELQSKPFCQESISPNYALLFRARFRGDESRRRPCSDQCRIIRKGLFHILDHLRLGLVVGSDRVTGWHFHARHGVDKEVVFACSRFRPRISAAWPVRCVAAAWVCAGPPKGPCGAAHSSRILASCQRHAPT